MTLASKHSKGGIGPLNTLTQDEKRIRGPISLHNAIVPRLPNLQVTAVRSQRAPAWIPAQVVRGIAGAESLNQLT
jgi:hypothetical protein